MSDELPRENLVRAIFPGTKVRDEDETPVLRGHFAVFDSWTRIDSAYEGTFMERIAPGAFADAFAGAPPKVLFQHGKDPQIGDKPLGIPSVLREDEKGAYYEVPLLDTAYNRDLIPGLKAGAYGASFRFSVVEEDFVRHPERSASNPEGLPERTVGKVRLHEFGPVTFPAYGEASAAVRSMTDNFRSAVEAARATTEAVKEKDLTVEVAAPKVTTSIFSTASLSPERTPP